MEAAENKSARDLSPEEIDRQMEIHNELANEFVEKICKADLSVEIKLAVVESIAVGVIHRYSELDPRRTEHIIATMLSGMHRRLFTDVPPELQKRKIN